MEFCSLASGSSGNSQYMATEKTEVLIDAGLSGRYIHSALENIGKSLENLNGILITHEHKDHVKGVGVLMRKMPIKIYVNEATWEAMKNGLGPVDENQVEIFNTNEAFQVGDMTVHPFPISHDAVDPVGFSVMAKNTKICVATDMGVASEEACYHMENSDFLMIEANHDENMLKAGPYPYYLKRRILGDQGHLSNTYAAKLLVQAAKKGRICQVLLGHLSRENNFPELAYETVSQIVEEENLKIGKDLNIDLAYRNKAGRLYRIDGCQSMNFAYTFGGIL